MTLSELEIKLGELLSNVGASAGLVDSIRRDTSECLREIRKDLKDHGGTGNEPFFNLLGYDSNPVDPCPFAFTLFRQNDLTIYVGMGLLHPLIKVAQRFTLAEVDELEAELVKLAPRPEAMTVARAVAEHWLAS